MLTSFNESICGFAREFPGGVVAISVLVKIKDSPLKKETSLAQIISHLPEVTSVKLRELQSLTFIYL